jgi:AraC-like DNA-binding protein
MKATIFHYGTYDSKKHFGSAKLSHKRTVHDFEIDYILSSGEEATSFINGESYPLRPNTLIIRKPGDSSQSRLHFTSYCLHIGIPQKTELHSLFSALPTCIMPLNDSRYKGVFEQLFQHNAAQEMAQDDLFSLSKILELCYYLQRDATIGAQTQQESTPHCHAAIKASLRYMEDNLDKPITLAQLGRIAGYSPNYFQREFKCMLGLSPQKYLEGLRISAAKLALSRQEVSLSEIAYACGFSSHPHFSLVFKKATGLTPQEYRRSMEITY